MSGFAKLQPAMTILVDIDAPLHVGSFSRGTPLEVVPMIGGSIKTESGFEPAIDAKLQAGFDYIRLDPTKEHMRLDVRSQVKTSDDALLALYYKGPVALSAGVQKILQGASDAKTTDFGDSFVSVEFETGSTTYKSLESMLLVAAGRFIKAENGPGVTVEYKVSRVVF